ncbi:MAG TPA: cytochrome c [Bryobacteraceae bacterium]|nr:cytochrome c [Bryobacteraceae bacterium]
MDRVVCPPFSSRGFLALTVVVASTLAWAQSYNNVGRAPTKEEIQAWDISVGTEGKELPPGSGTAKEGAEIFAKKCAACHGPTAEGSSLGPRLMGGKGTLNTPQAVRTIGSYWPFATTIWDYIHRAMPPNQGGSLAASEVYALTAFLLFRNGIVQESDIIDAKSLPKIQMPNRNGFVPVKLEDIGDLQKRGCRAGHCP